MQHDNIIKNRPKSLESIQHSNSPVQDERIEDFCFTINKRRCQPSADIICLWPHNWHTVISAVGNVHTNLGYSAPIFLRVIGALTKQTDKTRPVMRPQRPNRLVNTFSTYWLLTYHSQGS